MIKKIRTGFIIITVFLISLIVALFLFIDYKYDSYWNEKDTLELMEWFASQKDDVIFDETYEYLEFSSNKVFYAIWVNSSLQLMDIQASSADHSNIPSEDEIRIIFDQPRSKHKWHSYIYLIKEKPDGNYLLLLNKNQDSFNYYPIGNIIVFGIFVCAMIFISHLLSNIITIPVQKALDKEKLFILGASHEFKNPLSIIYTNAQILQLDLIDSIYLDNIINSVNRLEFLIQRLLSLSNVEQEGNNLIKNTFSLSELCESMVLSYESIIYENGLTFDYSIEHGITCNGNKEELSLLLMVLLENAIQHSSINGSLYFSLKVQKKSCICICNTVDNISSKDLQHLSDIFYRKNRITPNSHGLGLAMAKIIVTNHNGDIQIKYDENTQIISFEIKI